VRGGKIKAIQNMIDIMQRRANIGVCVQKIVFSNGDSDKGFILSSKECVGFEISTTLSKRSLRFGLISLQSQTGMSGMAALKDDADLIASSMYLGPVATHKCSPCRNSLSKFKHSKTN